MIARKQEEIQEVKRFTGMCSFQVAALNPTLEELKSMGVTYIQNEPSYTTDKDGVQGLKLDIWLKNSIGENYTDTDGSVKNSGPLFRKFTIFIDNALAKSSTGKFRALNNLLQNSYVVDLETLINNEKMHWFSKGHDLRLAKTGEIETLTFFQKLLNLKTGYKEETGDEVKFTTPWSKIVSGDLKELKGYITEANKVGNGLRFLLGIKVTEDNKKYDDIYNKYYQSSKNTKTTYMEKALVEQEFNSDYQNSLVFQLYTGTTVPKPSTTVATTVAEVESDLPF